MISDAAEFFRTTLRGRQSELSTHETFPNENHDCSYAVTRVQSNWLQEVFW